MAWTTRHHAFDCKVSCTKKKKDNPNGLSFYNYLMVQTGDISLLSVSFIINRRLRTPLKTAGHSLRTCANRSHDTSDW